MKKLLISLLLLVWLTWISSISYADELDDLMNSLDWWTTNTTDVVNNTTATDTPVVTNQDNVVEYTTTDWNWIWTAWWSIQYIEEGTN